jgi:hypothetical protein
VTATGRELKLVEFLAPGRDGRVLEFTLASRSLIFSEHISSNRTTMSDENEDRDQRCALLKSEIKDWERSHLEKHGSKVTRKEITSDAAIGT